MARRVLVTAGVARHEMVRIGGLADAGLRVVERFDLDDIADHSKLVAGLEGAWATIAGSEAYPRDLLDQTGSLRAIARWGSGYDRIDVGAATERGIAVITVPGANADPVADYALLLMLACVRRLRTVEAAVRDGAWRMPDLAGDLTSATVGVVGLGSIGRAVVRRLRGFDCRILGNDPDADLAHFREMGVELSSLPELLSRSDIVTLHAPLTSSTKALIGARELALMRSGAILVNTSRGELVDEDALVSALEGGHLGGAGLDVFTHEPIPASDRLLRFDNVIVSGHIASFTRLAARRTADTVVEGLLGAARGSLPTGCINPEAWAPVHAP
jgi:phosphoglycerate dehydrogenase-like enzyme